MRVLTGGRDAEEAAEATAQSGYTENRLAMRRNEQKRNFVQ